MIQDAAADKLRRARDSYAVVLRSLLREFADDPKTVFCLIEGRDGAYYKPVVVQKLENLEERRTVEFKNCDGKGKVEQTYRAVKQNASLREIIMITFVDLDFHEGIESFDREDTWITERYSIENYYTDHGVFREIFKEVFLKDAVLTDQARQLVNNVVDAYTARQSEYHQSIEEFNHWCWVHRKIIKQGSLNLNYYEQHPPVAVSYSTVMKNYKVEDLDGRTSDCRSVCPEDMEAARNWFSGKNPSEAYRGKQEARFMHDFIASLMTLADQGKEPFGGKVKHSLRNSWKEFVSDYSRFAHRPKNLLDFLDQFKYRRLV